LYAVSKGLIAEGAVTSLKIVNVRVFLLVGPPLLGWLFYQLASSAAGAEILMDVVSQCYAHILPKLAAAELQYFLAPPLFISVDRYVQRESSKKWINVFTDNWIKAFVFFLAFISLAIMAHAVYLSITARSFPVWAVIVTTVIAILFWIRGALLLMITNEFVFGE
jgi:hypothetical protein